MNLKISTQLMISQELIVLWKIKKIIISRIIVIYIMIKKRNLLKKTHQISKDNNKIEIWSKLIIDFKNLKKVKKL